MAFLRIHCAYCGGTWDVYHRQRELDPALRCPHCDSKIDPATWRDQILPAYNSMRGANGALLDDHISYHTPRFEVDYINDGTFQNSGEKDAVIIDVLRESLDDLGGDVGELRVNFQRLCNDLADYVRKQKEGEKK